MWVDGNRFTNTGSSPGLEGVGILGGAAGGTPVFSWAITHNTGTRGNGSPGNIGGRDVDCHGLLVGWNTTAGAVGCAIVKAEPTLADCAFVNNKCDRVLPDAKTVARLKLNPPLTVAGLDPPAVPTKVTAEAYRKDAVEITWTGGKKAVGFRVERRMGEGKWQVIAYRPPQLQGDAENPQSWVDFTAPAGKALSYRVVAVDPDDNDKSASAPTAAITL